MALKGTLKRWNDERGFGFIAPAGGGHEIFVHRSAFPCDGMEPQAGEALEYEFGRGEDGKPRAVRAWRPGFSPPSGPAPGRKRDAPRAGRAALVVSIGIAVALAMIARGYIESQQEQGIGQAVFAPATEPVSAAANIGTSRFHCDGRTHCSQMSSCEEARYFLANCPGTRMDGDGDGVPCEQQWCSGPLGR